MKNTLLAFACAALMLSCAATSNAAPLDRGPCIMQAVPTHQVQQATTIALSSTALTPTHVTALEHVTLQPQSTVECASLFNFFSTEQECCGGSGGWHSPYLHRWIAGSILLLLGAAFVYRLRFGARLPWSRH
jgi:hypothetical protein